MAVMCVICISNINIAFAFLDHVQFYLDMSTTTPPTEEIPEDPEMIPEFTQDILSARVIRMNYSYLYQHLVSSHSLQQLLQDKCVISVATTKKVDLYRGKYAHNAIIIGALLTWECPPGGLLKLADTLAVTIGQEHIGQKLTEGKLSHYYSSLLF